MAPHASDSERDALLVLPVEHGKEPTQNQTSPHPLLGLACVAASALCFSGMSTVAKYEARALSPLETVFWRSLVTWILNYICVRLTRQSLYVAPRDRRVLLFRCCVGFGSIVCVFISIAHLVLADASVIIFTSPIVTFFFGACLLGEAIDPVGLVCALCSFSGLVCVVRPAFLFGDTAAASSSATSSSWVGILAGLGSAVFQGFVYTSVRQLRQLHFLVILHYFMLLSGSLALLYLVVVEHHVAIPSTLGMWLAVLGNGVFTFLGQSLLTKGFQLEKAGIASVMRYLDVVFVFIWDAFLLHERINPWSVVGAVIICSSASVLALRRAKVF